MAIQTDSAIVDVNVRYRVQGLETSAKKANTASNAFSKFGKVLKQVGLSLIAFKAVDGIIKSINGLVRVGIESNSVFEKASVQLEVFTANAKLAGQTLDFLAFQSTRLAGGLEDLIEASTALETFGLSTFQELELVADVAQAIGREVADVAIAFGRIVIGDPRTKQFLTTRRGDVREFNRVLAETGDRLLATRAAFSRFEGVSKELEGTYARLVENIEDFFFLISQSAFSKFFNEGKLFLGLVRDVLQEEAFGKDKGIIAKLLGAAPDAAAQWMRTIRNDITFIDNLSKGKLQSGGRGATFRQLLDPTYFPEDDTKKSATQRLEDNFRRTNRTAGDIDRRIENLITGDLATIKEIAEKNLPRALRIADNIIKQYTDSGLGQINDANKRIASLVIKIEQDAKEGLDRSLKAAGAGLKLSQGATDDEFFGKGTLDQAEAFVDNLRHVTELSIASRAQQIDDAVWIEDREKRHADNLKEIHIKAMESQSKEAKKIAERTAREAAKAVAVRLQNLGLISGRATGLLSSIFFGGDGGVGRQIEALKRELSGLDGSVAPLTRQEELLNRIVELESQRVTLADRLGNAFKSLALEIAEAATQAAIMNLLINKFGGGQGGGFLNLFKQALGFASVIPSPIQPFAQGAKVSSGGFNPDFGGDIGIRPSLKPTIINNPVFLGADASSLVSRAVQINERRTR